ncbi:MAG: hypothetical protein MJA29_04435 [Candidatus Omnitrophica bacterium]|nr:hypothetical protein [Candidatus Omnitrophota bacterium]
MLNNGKRFTEDEIKERIARATDAFKRDHRNYLPQYSWRNQELGRRLELRYGHLDEEIPIGETGRVRVDDRGLPAREQLKKMPDTLTKEAFGKLYEEFQEMFNKIDIDEYAEAVTGNPHGNPFFSSPDDF